MSAVLKTFDDLMTADEFFNSPFTKTHELVKGRLVPLSGKGILKMPAGFEHGTIAAMLTEELRRFARENKLGVVAAAETGFRLFENPDSIRGADVAFVGKEKLKRNGTTVGFFPEAPDLAVEVVSPGNTKADVQEKVEEYLSAGTRLIWIVRPQKKTVFIYRANGTISFLGENDYLEGEDLLPGLRLSLKEIFELPFSDED